MRSASARTAAIGLSVEMPFTPASAQATTASLVELGGSDDCGQVRHVVPEQRLEVRVERLHTEALPQRRAALGIVLGYGDYLGVRVRRIRLGVLLSHPPTPDNGNPMYLVRHVNSLSLNPLYSSSPTFTRKKVYSSATSYRLSYLPDLPPWPAPMFVLSTSMLSSVFSFRSFATYLAGSQ